MKATYKIRIYSAKTGCVSERTYYHLKDLRIAKWAIFDAMLTAMDDFIVYFIDISTGNEQIIATFRSLEDWYDSARDPMTGAVLLNE